MTTSTSPFMFAAFQRWREHKLAVENANVRSRWIWIASETVVANLGALLYGYWVAPDDPFGVAAEFPWLWIVPTLLAMRYGTVVGISSVLLLLGAWLFSQQAPGSDNLLKDFPGTYFLGGLALNLLAGQFADVWNARTRRIKAVNAYLDERLALITKNHFLLRLSHQRLEQDMLTKPLTLRETLLRLRQLSSVSAADERLGVPAAEEFMQLLAQSCQLEVAGIYPMHEGRLRPQAAAVLGACGDLVMDDPLLRYCLAQEELVHVQTTMTPEEIRDASRYLVCVPVKPTGSSCVAVVVVERMPFFALNNDSMQLLTVMAGYYADGLQTAIVTREIVRRLPHCPTEMALDIVRLHRLRAQAGIDSSMVALVFNTDVAAGDMFDQIKRSRRGVDLAWELSSPRRQVLITLLPLAGPAAVEGYLLRIDAELQSRFGTGLNQSHIGVHTAIIGMAAPDETLWELVRRCGL